MDDIANQVSRSSQDIERLAHLLGYFEPQVLAPYRGQPDKYDVKDDNFEGRVRTTEAHYRELEKEERTGESLDVLFGYRTLKSGELAIVVWLPDLRKTAPRQEAQWSSFRLQGPQWLDYELDTRFQLWVRRYLDGDFGVEMGPLERLRSEVALVRGLTEETVGIPLFKHDDSASLHFPAAENTHSYQDAHRDLYGYLIDGLNKDSIERLATQLGRAVNVRSSNTLDGLKKVVPALGASPTFTGAFEQVSNQRRQAAHGVREPAARYSAFDAFAKDLEACVSALHELRVVLEQELGLDAEIATARMRAKREIPEIVEALPEHVTRYATRITGKTVASVKYGLREQSRVARGGEVLNIHFTDGSVLSIEPLTNIVDLSSAHDGLDPEDLDVGLWFQWVPPELPVSPVHPMPPMPSVLSVPPDTDRQVALMGQVLNDLLRGDESAARGRLEAVAEPTPVPGAVRSSMSLRTQARVFARDRYVCAYCGRLTICPPALRYISERFPTLVPYHPHGKWDLTHSLYWDAYASCDHLVPVARGGSSDMENLVTSCYRCNTMKTSWLLEELGWTRRPVPETDWDGLSGLFVQAMQAAPIETTYFRTWASALAGAK